MIDEKYKSNVMKAVFLFYVILVTIITQFPIYFKFNVDFSVIQYNLVPFNFLMEQYKMLKEVQTAGYDINKYILPTVKMIFESFGYNIILFLPFGFLVPILYKKYSSFIKIAFVSFVFSFLIEITQLIIMTITLSSVRVFDVDDILANVIGGMIGYFIYLCLDKLTQGKFSKMPKVESSN